MSLQKILQHIICNNNGFIRLVTRVQCIRHADPPRVSDTCSMYPPCWSTTTHCKRRSWVTRTRTITAFHWMIYIIPRPPSATVVSAEPFSHGTGTLRCLQKEMATYRHWSMSWSMLMSHIVESCPLTKLNGGLSRLHSADEDAVSWLTNYGKWHAYEKKNWMIMASANGEENKQQSGPIMGSLKSSCQTCYRSSIETIALNCLVFEKISFWRQKNEWTNERTDGRTDGQQRRFNPQARYRERWLNN